MKITGCRNKSYFGAGISQLQREFIQGIDHKKVATNLANIGIQADFHNNNLIAGLTQKSCEIAQELGLTLPQNISTFKKPRWLSGDMGLTITNGTHADIKFNRAYFPQNIDTYNKICDKQQNQAGSTHALNTMLHELLHAHHYRNFPSEKEATNMWQLDITDYADEISSKIGQYAIETPLELHATYWAKEICDSLNKDWKMKYNPLKQPKTKLSKDLRNLITAISSGDVRLARKLTES